MHVSWGCFGLAVGTVIVGAWIALNIVAAAAAVIVEVVGNNG